jgi:glycosyltransferase involved in cell wall biosynthesis
MRKISFTVINDLVTDQRVHRSAQTLCDEGSDVTLIGRILSGSLPVTRNYKNKRLKLLFIRGPLFYLEYNIRIFFYLLFKKVDILVAIDLDTLLANYLVSVIRRKPLVYDAHELFTEMPELVGRERTKRIWTRIEKIILPKIKYSYTVCASIADTYNSLYGIQMKVVRNVPFKKDPILPVKTFDFIPKLDFVLYQGAINKGRGLEMLVDAFVYINDFNCLIVGDGDIIDELRERVIIKKLEQKVTILGRVPFDDLYSITCQASLGVSIEENLGMNYYYALPNKLFDYIQARIPVLVSDFPEMRKIVEEYQIGETLISREPQKLAQQLTSILTSKKRDLWKQNLEKAAGELNWENEKKKLIEIFENLETMSLT